MSSSKIASIIVWIVIGVVSIVCPVCAVLATAWFILDPVMEMLGYDDSSWYFITYEWWFYSVWIFSVLGTSFVIGPILKVKALNKFVRYLSPNKAPGLVLCTLGAMILGLVTIALVVLIILEFSVSDFPTHFSHHVSVYLFGALSFTGALLLGISGYRGFRKRFSRNTTQQPSSHTTADNVTSDNMRQAPLEAEGIDISENADFAMQADFAPAFHSGDHTGEEASFAYAQANYETPLADNESTGVQMYSSFMHKSPDFEEEESNTSYAPAPDSNGQTYDPYNINGNAYDPYSISNTGNSGTVSYGFEATTTYHYVRCNKFCAPNPQTGQMEQAFLCRGCHDQLMSNCTTCGKSIDDDHTTTTLRTGHLCQRCTSDSNGCCTRCNVKLLQDRYPVRLCSDCSRYGLDTACVKKIQ